MEQNHGIEHTLTITNAKPASSLIIL